LRRKPSSYLILGMLRGGVKAAEEEIERLTHGE
jgi:hypothetical protein